MIFVVASLIVCLTVIVAANIWLFTVLRNPPETELWRSLSKAIDELLEVGEEQPGHDRVRRTVEVV